MTSRNRLMESMIHLKTQQIKDHKVRKATVAKYKTELAAKHQKGLHD
jgi:hypothetical protein